MKRKYVSGKTIRVKLNPTNGAVLSTRAHLKFSFRRRLPSSSEIS